MASRVKATRPITLDFDEEGPYQGAHIVLAGMTVGDYFDTFNEASSTEDMIKFLGGKLRDWNLDGDDDQPLPPNADGLRKVGPELLRAIFDHLNEALMGVPAPLEKPSETGSSMPDIEIPMVVLLPSSLPSLDVPSSSLESANGLAASPVSY